MGFWSVDPWVVRRRGKTTYVERQETRTGSSLRQPYMRVLAALLLLVLNVIVHQTNPVGLSHAAAYIPLYGTAFNFLCRSMLQDDTSSTNAARVIAAIVSLLLGAVLARRVVFPALHESWTMFSAGHASFRYVETKAADGTVEPMTYRSVSGVANDGKAFRHEVHIGSSSQGSWAVMLVITPLVMVVAASIYNCFVPSTLAVTGVVDVSYVDLYPPVRGISLVFNALVLFAVLDTMLQDSNRCDAVYGGWMQALRTHVWRHHACRILFFWLYAVGAIIFAVHGLPRFSTWCQALFQHSSDHLLHESWRSFLSGLVVVLHLVVLVQDWDFPTLATVRGIYLPGLKTECLALRVGRRRVVFTGKWLVASLTLWMLPLDMWVFGQQLNYEAASYGQVTDPTTHQIMSITNATWLAERACGVHCYTIPANVTGLSTEPTVGRHFDWPVFDQMPAVYITLIALFLFFRLAWTEDSRYTVAAHMQGVKATTYSTQLQSSELTAVASDALRQLATIKHLYALRKHVDGVCITLAMLGLLLMLFQLHSIWEVDVVFGHVKYPRNTLSAPGQTYSIVILISTLVLASQLVTRTQLTLQIAKLRHQVPACATLWRHPATRFTLAAELVANLWIVPPFITGFVTLDEFQFDASTCTLPMIQLDGGCYYRLRYPVETLGLVMLVRLYWIVRLVRNHSGFYGQRVDFLGSLHNVSTDSPLWHFRAIFHHRPVFAFVFCTLVTWLATAAGVSVMERSIPSALDSDLTSSWLIVVTMATVGYGDYFARTRGGRFLTVMGGIIGGTIVISMLTSLFMGSLQTTFGEERVLYVVRYKRWQKARLDAAVNLIKAAWRRHKLEKANKATHSADRALFKYMQKVRELRLGAITDADDVVGKVREWKGESVVPLLVAAHAKRSAVLDDLGAKVQRVESLVVTIESLVLAKAKKTKKTTVS